MDNVAAAQRLARPIAPGVTSMTLWYAVAFAGFTPALRLAQWFGVTRPWAMAAAMVLFLGACVLCHRAYLRAKVELAANPGLAGGWFVENAWWVLLAVPIVVSLVLGGVIAAMVLT